MTQEEMQKEMQEELEKMERIIQKIRNHLEEMEKCMRMNP